MERSARREVLWRASLAVLAVLCGVLAVLQYRWTGEISRAERDRLKSSLDAGLNRVRDDFNTAISSAVSAQPPQARVDAIGLAAAYTESFARWKQTGDFGLYRRVGVVVPEQDSAGLLLWDEARGGFQPAAWPAEWEANKTLFRERLYRRGPPPFAPREGTLLEVPRMTWPPVRDGFGERDWLLLEVNAEYAREKLIPELVERHLGPDYEAHITAGRERPATSGDASVRLFELRRTFRGGPGFGGRPGFGGGRWLLSVHHRSGSLDALAARARWRNLGISSLLLVLLLGTSIMLVRLTRESQRLAEAQMHFVAGVSHELRTPLTVIRTAAYNLKGRIAANPEQVERYGGLIQQETDRLTGLVEQVLRFASIRAGQVIRQKEPVAVEELIDQGLRSATATMEGARCTIERNVASGLPLVMADELALRHALQNLFDNAIKYGTEGSNWIGITASAAADGQAVEIRVQDRGPGIPKDEQRYIFEPFFRGSRAVGDQIHGTGLGLSLVKRIVEAHGGSVEVHSAPGQGTEFVIRVPAAPQELQDEFAHTAG